MNAPVFIVGPNHSGTSLMLAILDAHPAMRAIPAETRCFIDMDKQQRETLFAAQGEDRWVEKTPKHLFRIDAILRRFPDARVICMVRDPFDLVASYLERISMRKKVPEVNESVSKAANAIAEAFKEIIRWGSHPQVHRVAYERLVHAPRLEIKQVCDFLGIPQAPEMLDFHRTSKAAWFPTRPNMPRHEVLAHRRRRERVATPIYSSKVGRGQAELSEKHKRIIARKIAGFAVDPVRVGDHSFLYPENSAVGERSAASSHFYEQDMLLKIREWGLGGKYLDVGASVGNHSVYFASHCNANTVIAFEPKKTLIQLLQLNTLAHPKVRIVPQAVLDVESYQMHGTIAAEGGPREATRLSKWIRSGVTFVKMDIEGWETRVLREAAQQLAQVKPALAVECQGGVGSAEFKKQERLLVPMGYKLLGVYNATPTMLWKVV